jgi:hypothetical protein
MPSSHKAHTPSQKKTIKNNEKFPFSWKTGNLNTNIILEHEKLNVQLLRYLVTSATGEIMYDGLAIKESPNNAVTVIRNQDKEIGLIWEWRPIPAKWFWACVRGYSDPKDQGSLAVGKRELIEEIGDCRIINAKRIGSIYQNTAYFENPTSLVLLDVEINSIKLSHEEGITDFNFFSKDIIFEMIRENTIEDTFTLSALLKYFVLYD